MKTQRWATLCCPHWGFHSRREKQGWLPDGKELANPAKLRSLSLRKWAGHRTVKSPRAIQGYKDLGLDAREPARGHQWTSLPDSSRHHGITIQNGKAGKWILSSSGKKKMGQRKWKGWSPMETLFRPDLISDGGNYKNMCLKSYSIQARNYWRDMDEKSQLHDQRFPFRWEIN